jgi:hypothetical protein
MKHALWVMAFAAVRLGEMQKNHRGAHEAEGVTRRAMVAA